MFQHVPVTEKVKNIEVNRLRNGYKIDPLISVDIQEIGKIGGKAIEIEGNVLYQKNSKTSPFRKVLGKLFFQDKNVKMKVRIKSKFSFKNL